MATSFWGAGAFGARAARIKTRISYVHRISSYRRCARPWAFTNMSGETPYFDLFFVSIRSARRGSTRSRYIFNSSAGVVMTIDFTAAVRIKCFLLALSGFISFSLLLSNADSTASIALGIISLISGQGVPRSSARSANVYFLPGRTSPISAYDSMHLSAWRSACSFSSRQRSQPVEDNGHLLHGFFDTFFPRRGAVRRFHVVKYSSQSSPLPLGLQPRGEVGDWGSRPAPSPQVGSACWLLA
jgi:hypothetical protein